MSRLKTTNFLHSAALAILAIILTLVTLETTNAEQVTSTTPKAPEAAFARFDDLKDTGVTNRLFQWTRHPEDYASAGKSLTGHTFFTYTHKYVSSQCALECLRHHKCRSFNFDRDTGRCELNDASHIDFPGDLSETRNSEYHVREAFSIDPEALGPCAQNPCNDRGQCIETKSSEGDLMAVCLCNDGWTGTTCQLQANAVEWGEWEDWGQCSVTCHRGWRMRRRKCVDMVTGNAVSSLECYGADVEYGVCVLQECPKWEEWGEWGECSAARSCGRGIKVRHRACSNGGVPGVDRYCLGSTNQSTPCEGIDCRGAIQVSGGTNHGEGRLEVYNDLTGEWGLMCADQMTPRAAQLTCKQLGFPGAHAAVTDGRFGAGSLGFSLTSVKCEGGERSLLECPHNTWATNSTCTGGTKLAAGVQCNVNGAWSLWSSWGECSVTCENGTRTRTRKCNHPPQMHAGKPCEGEDIQFKPCQLPMCPGNGAWSHWSAWTSCDSSCMTSRTRMCFGAFEKCDGPGYMTRECEAAECGVVDGIWGPWSVWSPCSLSCSNGTQERTRECKGPFYGGQGCVGDEKQIQVCKLRECPVDGVWEEWGAWGACTLTCGNGTRTRSRSCTGPFHGGKECEGSASSTERCNVFSCPVDGEWFPWQEWQPCNVTCGGGWQIRERVCNTPKYGGKTCDGVSMETKQCGDNPCPIDGVWQDWSEWGTCSVTCGNGTQYRNRTCFGPFHGGAPCSGEDSQSQTCHPRMCPVDGSWMDWEAWSACTVTCGGGERTRTRECYRKHGGDYCEGEGVETGECNTQGCPVDGVWLEWGQWGACTQTCGSGTRTRMRTCDGPLYGGANCTGPGDESETCNPDPCPETLQGCHCMPVETWQICPTHKEVKAALNLPLKAYVRSRAAGQTSVHITVDGVEGEWQAWSACSLSCGGGVRSRERPCIGPFHGGAPCAVHLNESEACNEQPCPIDGVWHNWGEWSTCNVTCGGGIRMRERTCDGPYHGGANCSGDWEKRESCNAFYCPVDGQWTPWMDWSACDVTCGGGTQLRKRICAGRNHGGAPCEGEAEETQSCNTHKCPVDGVLTDWSEWTLCDVTCGGGVRWRERTCDGPYYGGAECEGALRENSSCNTQHCPVDGVWQEWSTWSLCTVTCGGGSQWRARNCTGPFYGGAECPGPANETQACNEEHCPEDGYWTQWSTWTECSASCDGGLQRRERTCEGRKNNGKNCTGESVEVQGCNPHNCPVDGVLSDWSDWSQCTLTCGGGTQWRNRTCIGPFFGGKDCLGARNETQGCNTQFCPVDGYFTEWSAWGACSVTCGGGSQGRNRTCVPPKYGGQDCVGPDHETQTCNTHNCPIDGYYHEWSVWSTCSVTCGGGSQSRSRVCEAPKYGGKDCDGPADETQDCNTHPCPIDGVWMEWSDWSNCNTTCGGGTSVRTRGCVEPQHGGKPCAGPSAEYKSCAENPCPIPGDWFAWTPWSPCSVTCGGGKRDRSRECDMTSYGDLTAPCEGDDHEIADCHTFPCRPLARTCTEWADKGLTASTVADVDPDGNGELEPVEVYCDMVAEGGRGVTHIGHDSEVEERVKGFEGALEYDKPITYNISIDHVVAIIDQSEHCAQFISWKCKAALIHNTMNSMTMLTTGWLNRTYGVADYFGGATPGSNSCACGMTNSCGTNSKGEPVLCHCDINDDVWREDSGNLTYKPDLPVTHFRAGDTGGKNEDGYQTVGRVLCWGAAK